jgi:hypothetical protein
MAPRKKAAKSTKRNLTVTRQTVKDLGAKRRPRGGFIMKDTVICPRGSHGVVGPR